MQELSKEDLAKAEAGGFPIVALILLIVFGSLAAAVLPLALGFISVIVTGALIYFISLNMETSVFVTNMASMIGIGVAIDYSLFILARYREERAGGAQRGGGARGGAGDLGPGGHLLRPGRDRLPGRAVDGRQPGAALDGAGRDDRRRRLDPHRDHPAARPDRDARRPRAAGRGRGAGALFLQAPRLPPARPTGDCRIDLLAALDGERHGPTLDGRDRGQRRSSLPRDPGALADHRHPGAQPVPQGQRRAGRQRTGLATGRRRHRSRPDRRRL